MADVEKTLNNNGIHIKLAGRVQLPENELVLPPLVTIRLEKVENIPLGRLFHDALGCTRGVNGRWNFTAAGAALKTEYLTTQFSDWLRVLLLWRYGGLYMDVD